VGWEEKVRSTCPDKMDIDEISQVDAALLVSARDLHDVGSSAVGTTFAQDFGARKMDMSIKVLNMPERDLIPAWETCIRNTLRAKVGVEDEVAKAKRSNVSPPLE
jgi:ubiquitin carboxyl-terminal hydrolase L5